MSHLQHGKRFLHPHSYRYHVIIPSAQWSWKWVYWFHLVRPSVSALFSMLFSALWLGCGELGMRKYSLRYGWNTDIMRRFLRIPVRILPSAFSPHSFPYQNAEISPRSCPNTAIRIFSAFPPHFFPYKNAEISSRSCPNTPICIFSARKMQRSGVRGLKKSTLVPVRAWCQNDGKPLPQPKFTQIPDVIWHHLATISLLISPLVPHYRGVGVGES